MFNDFFFKKMPENLIVLINFLAIFLLYMYKSVFDPATLLWGSLFIITIYVANHFLSKLSPLGDNYIFLIVSMLSSIGIIMIYRLNPRYGLKQVAWFAIGIIFYFATYMTIKRVKNWQIWTNHYMIISVVLFLLTLILGDKINGAINWIKIGSIGLQPSELIKILFVFYMASYYSNKKMNFYVFLCSIYVFILFLFIQRDLGTAMIFYFTFFMILYINEDDRKQIYVQILLAIIIAILSYIFVYHVRVRVIAWLDPWKYIEKEGYQITQSLFAIGSGGFFGTGLGLGYPKLIPEVHTDFIFSAICEELGIFGGIAVIMLFLILIYRGFKIALNQHDRFFKIVSIGMTVILGFQAFIIIGGVTKFIPLTGVTLPFVSYGGSSLVSSFLLVGILQVASEEIDTYQEDKDEHHI
ncbi:MAG: FtsW/RodA/SpoVE family cell cycle protein [Anaeromicrobium sp.]|jgi:cell division protein FtsW (lipid II flippase)|uniref:FtsW/RodA/SpoVE family cell cycle protein n=1 Tax=Anaeromicrobium sp. TaxID=1929132 RepID=UPI0025F83F85|nr:FtsW/RodA/SpoVE family cell cycle protein [Anaeromicrobium sp.]MCT4595150.1 FtsW/RodA/SpoVE family cell cycle protein [Anaeromicrobium sp.]